MNSYSPILAAFPVPADEDARLASLPAYDVMRPLSDMAYDRLATMGAHMFHMPACVISIVGSDVQIPIGRHGVAMTMIPRAVAFCTQTILDPEPDAHVVADVLADDRYRRTTLKIDDRAVRFYAGAPIVNVDGVVLGTICLLDVRPHADFSAAMSGSLRRLAGVVAAMLDERRARLADLAGTRFAESTVLAVVTADERGHIRFWNDAATAMFGHSRRDAIGRKLTLIVPERFRRAHSEGFARLMSGPSALSGKTVEVQALHRNGREFPIEMSLSQWPGETGIAVGAHIQDISARRAREAALRHLADHDALTGLLNRRGFVGQVRHRLATQRTATVLALDLDGFKKVNDAFGYAVGDAFLQALAVRLTAVVEGGGVIGRIDGDEFALLLTGPVDIARAEKTAQALLDASAEPVTVADHTLPVDMSIGIAAAPVHADDVDELLIRSDLALFRSKKDGGGTYRVFDDGMNDELVANRTFKAELGQARARREWQLYYQPQYSLHDGRMIGAEALLRWRHPTRGLLLPAAFIELLETHAAAYDVGCWVIDEACRQLASWRAAGLTLDRVSVNLFAAQIRMGNLQAVVMQALDRHGLLPQDLELEITETIALRHDDELIPLRALHAAGVAIAFDDFGTGFASLTTLKRFPLSRVKVDRSFVADLCSEPHSAAIVEGMIAIGHRLGLCVIAEGIETDAQARALTILGCDEGQGYLYGRPMTADSILLKFAAPIPPLSPGRDPFPI